MLRTKRICNYSMLMLGGCWTGSLETYDQLPVLQTACSSRLAMLSQRALAYRYITTLLSLSSSHLASKCVFYTSPLAATLRHLQCYDSQCYDSAAKTLLHKPHLSYLGYECHICVRICMVILKQAETNISNNIADAYVENIADARL